ncbi:hypothetical protein [Kistimonas asteriae]|uniref:hypothetical protein n=1 Tax=Kistimonas asteriae TaxID=517724 RepID=UPI001BADE88C|nr:hypothetical protein [Kistimonas asteriae]
MQYPESAILATFAEALGAPYGFERSVKFCESQMLDDRFLMTVHKASLGKRPEHKLETLCQQLNAPADVLASVLALLPEADIVHLGFEAEADARLCKLYVEFASTVRAAMETGQIKSPLLVHKALKWNVEKPQRHAITQYWLNPESELGHWIDEVSTSADEHYQVLSSFLQQVLMLTAERLPAEELMCLEVNEPGNPRKSFDINLYDTDMILGDIRHLLEQLAEAFRIEPGKVARWLDNNTGQPLGHLSSGIARDGRPFATVYFGIEGR